MKLLLFTGDNCGACKSAKQYADSKQIDYAPVERGTSAYTPLAAKYFIMSIPILLILKNNIPIKQFGGSNCFQQFEKWQAGE